MKVHGRLSGKDGQPLGNALVEVNISESGFEARTNEKGKYLLHRPEYAGAIFRYVVTFRAAGFASVNVLMKDTSADRECDVVLARDGTTEKPEAGPDCRIYQWGEPFELPTGARQEH